MTVAAAEKKEIWTGNLALDAELSLLGDEELAKLADYAKYLRWSLEEDDDDWADAPLTEEEEAQLEEGRREFTNGEYLTLDEFMKGL
ncbi:MAG: hypothetical protein IJT02_04915 [Synergistaceae bacterium]|nr:hypothetical protein [Synergistaceae bacterium]